MDKGVISEDATGSIVDSTKRAALVPANVDETKITLADIKYVESWGEAQKLVATGNWKNLDGMHTAGKINIYMSATKASKSVYLSRTGAMAITGSQNMIETIHHEYLHYIGLQSHTSSSVGWGIRIRSDLGGWINEI